MRKLKGSILPSPEQQLYKNCEKELIKQASKYWVGRRARLKKFVRQYLKRHRHDTVFLKSVVRSSARAVMLSLLILHLNAKPLHAAGPGPFTEKTGAANPMDTLNVGYVSNPTFVDIDGDGDLDAFSGVGFDPYSDDGGTFKYYENTGGDTSAAFVERTGGANPMDSFDVGDASNPTFVDIDGDGDFDAFSGGYDGNELAAKGISVVNISSGQRDIHSKKEWLDIRQFARTCELMEALVHMW